MNNFISGCIEEFKKEGEVDFRLPSVKGLSVEEVQLMAELANAKAKMLDEVFYQEKSFLLKHLIKTFPENCQWRVSWGFVEVVVTSEAGRSSFHMPEFTNSDVEGISFTESSWDGIRRQMASLAISRESKLRSLLTRAAKGITPSSTERLNVLLAAKAEEYPVG